MSDSYRAGRLRCPRAEDVSAQTAAITDVIPNPQLLQCDHLARIASRAKAVNVCYTRLAHCIGEARLRSGEGRALGALDAVYGVSMARVTIPSASPAAL